MIIKIIIVLLLLASIYFLASAAYYMMVDSSNSKRMAKALTWRVGLAIVLFALLIVGYYLGWIQPHGLLQRPS